MTSLAELRAMQALDAARIARPARLEPASSVTNEVWIGGDVVVRINRNVGNRLRREAHLSRHLPPELEYPPVLAFGAHAGMDFLVLRRVRGQVLARSWPDMSLAHRRAAIAQLAEKLRLLHRTPEPAGLPEHAGSHLVDLGTSEPPGALRRALAELRRLPHIPPRLADELRELVDACAGALDGPAATHLVHGDLTFENVLWDGERITALLDFEWARAGPPDLELDVLLRMCAHPYLHVAADYEHRTRPLDYAEIPGWLAEDYPELFAAPRLHERLTVYSIAFDLRDLLDYPPRAPASALPRHHALNRLRATVAGRDHSSWFDGRPK